MRSHDVSFLMNSGTYSGTTYRFTLARVNGRKAWNVTRLYRQPPSMLKERIEMGIACREDDITLSGARDLVQANTIIDQLTIVANETTAPTLTGLDNQTRKIIVDKEAFSLESTFSESGKEPEYFVKCVCWAIHE